MEAASGSKAMMSCSEFSGEARPAWKTERQRLGPGISWAGLLRGPPHLAVWVTHPGEELSNELSLFGVGVGGTFLPQSSAEFDTRGDQTDIELSNVSELSKDSWEMQGTLAPGACSDQN